MLGIAIATLKRPDLPADPQTGRSIRTDTDKAVLWGSVLAAEAPDVDIVFPRLGLTHGIWTHRSVTHALVGWPVVALAAALIAKLIWRRARFGALYPYCLASTLVAHIAFDWLTSYGVRLFMPWSYETYSANALFILEPVITLPLLAAVIFGRYRPLRRRAVILAAAMFVFAYSGAKGYGGAALKRLVAADFGRTGTVIRAAVQPGLFGVDGWQYIVEYPDRYVTGKLRLPYRVVDREEFAKVDERTRLAMQTVPELREALSFFRYPAAQVNRQPDGYRVSISDLRFRFRGQSAFGATVWLDDNFSVQRYEIRRGARPREES